MAVITAAALSLCVSLGVGLRDAAAEQLPIRRYKVGDGLAHNRVKHIYQDRYGCLWISTFEGLSRFDGYRFVNYDRRHGLGNQVVNFVTEDRRGRLWVATNGGGLARLLEETHGAAPAAAGLPTGRKFVSYPVGNDVVNALAFDAEDSPWCVTDAGLFRGREDAAGGLTFELVEEGTQPIIHSPVLADSRGALWFGIRKGDGKALILRAFEGRVFRYVLTDDRQDDVTAVCEDARGRVLAATLGGRLMEFEEQPTAPEGGRWRPLPLEPLERRHSLFNIYALYGDPSGALWLGTNRGLVKYLDGQQTVYTTAHGLSDMAIEAITADRQGNLWLGTGNNGVCQLSDEQIVSFTKTEGVPDYNIHHIFEGLDGSIYAFSYTCCALKLTDDRVERVPGSDSPLFNSLWHGQVLHDLSGDWWFLTTSGLYRFPGPELQFRRGEKIDAALGLPEKTNFSRIFETADGRFWLGTWEGVIYQLELRPRPRLLRRLVLPELNGVFQESPLVMLSDARGDLWFSTRRQEALGRLSGETLTAIQTAEGLPGVDVRALFQDSRGWLWIGLRSGGVSVIKNPADDPLRFVNYSTARGLASDTVWSIAEDDYGRIYLATGKGLAQIDPVTGRLRMLAAADGLAGDEVWICFKDSRGHIWAVTDDGLSRLTPRPPEPPPAAPPVYFNRVRVAGEDLSLPERGALRLPYFEVAASGNNLLIEYGAVDLRGGTPLRYQYMLEGVDAEWGPPSEQRAVNYARLAPGSYRFLARAVNEDGVTGGEPASMEFRVLPPLYLRWWFVAAAVAALGLAAYALYRYRVARLVEIERVRTRIATDLHDDIGASLSLIAMLSEVGRRQAAQGDPKAFDSLSSIAVTSRELVDTTSDIVWAVNPRKDHFGEMVKRMRRFAGDALSARDVALRFSAPAHEYDFHVGADARREIFFIFKECVNNVARHADCAEAEITLSVQNGWLVLQTRDDGKGFDAAQEFDGNGLASMRERARRLGGEFTVVSRPGAGTTATLKAPLGRGRHG